MKELVQIEFLDIEENEEYSKIIEKVIHKCFEEENLLKTKLYMSIILTTPDKIQEMNNEYRKINKATDVLSFPMFEKDEISNLSLITEEPLGDIVISIEKVREQAEEYGHSFERELAYMVVHGFYHLMGYDHIELTDRTEMREKEENILNQLSITREI
ncbi:MAG: rRNA maturation RNase YbeY [Clostridia bacterium]|jgi:probable rRNA maturation factor|nr:rRNA maturation RNase YbeY [Clostridia bacterium]